MPEKEDYTAIFKAEAEELLTKLENGLVVLETHPDDFELIKELNRVAHTLKGASRVFNFQEIQNISHKIEEIFVQTGQKTIVFTSGIAEKIFKSIDILKNILKEIQSGGNIPADISEICRELDECLQQGPPPTEEPSVKKLQSPAAAAPECLKREKGHEKPILNNANGLQESRTTPTEEYVRISLSKIKDLNNLAGELGINVLKIPAQIVRIKKLSMLAKDAQKKNSRLSEKFKKELSVQDEGIAMALSRCSTNIEKLKEYSISLYDNISTESYHTTAVVDELRVKMKALRMIPCSSIFESFPRMIRDIAAQEKKEVLFEVSGENTEVDRHVLEVIKPSLIHILRNCVDHGIEEPDKRIALGKPNSGTIKLSAYYQSDNVIITVEDDGRGIDVDLIKEHSLKKHIATEHELAAMTEQEVLNLVFLNGFSTSPIITDISGRGIGLDAAKRNIMDLKGQIFYKTEKDKGTRFTVVLPLTVAITQVLLVKENGMLFALPLRYVYENIKVSLKEFSTIEGKMSIQLREHTVPVVNLREVLDLPLMEESNQDDSTNKEVDKEKDVYVVILGFEEKRVGFIVSEIMNTEEVLLKNLGEYLGKINNVSNSAILGSGEVVVVLNVADLIANSSAIHQVPAKAKLLHKEEKTKKILVVEDSLSVRELEKSIIENHGYTVDTAVDGLDGLDKLLKSNFDLIVTDIQMPRMDGFEFCQTLKKNTQYKDIPVVIVTTLEKTEDKRRGIEVGAQAYIVKSVFNQANLLDTIKRLVGKIYVH